MPARNLFGEATTSTAAPIGRSQQTRLHVKANDQFQTKKKQPLAIDDEQKNVRR